MLTQEELLRSYVSFQLETQEHRGVISRFDQTKGYGFIESSDVRQIYGRDVFIHRGEFPAAQQGVAVAFTVTANGRGLPQAMNVRELPVEDAAAVKAELHVQAANGKPDVAALLLQQAQVQQEAFHALKQALHVQVQQKQETPAMTTADSEKPPKLEPSAAEPNRLQQVPVKRPPAMARAHLPQRLPQLPQTQQPGQTDQQQEPRRAGQQHEQSPRVKNQQPGQTDQQQELRRAGQQHEQAPRVKNQQPGKTDQQQEPRRAGQRHEHAPRVKNFPRGFPTHEELQDMLRSAKSEAEAAASSAPKPAVPKPAPAFRSALVRSRSLFDPPEGFLSAAGSSRLQEVPVQEVPAEILQLYGAATSTSASSTTSASLPLREHTGKGGVRADGAARHESEPLEAWRRLYSSHLDCSRSPRRKL